MLGHVGLRVRTLDEPVVRLYLGVTALFRDWDSSTGLAWYSFGFCNACSSSVVESDLIADNRCFTA